MTSRTPILMLLATAVLGIYVLPAVTARFAGTHTMELNQTDRIEALDCEKCHTYILSELGATSVSTDILTAHRTAATEVLYVGDEGILNITKNATDTDGLANVNRSACMLCHLITRNVSAAAINQTHTKVTIRVCTDDQCHGAGVEAQFDVTTGGVNASWATDALNVTQKLAQETDVHSKFYNPMDSATSYYADQQGTGNYSRGFYACMACHTHLGVSFNLSRPRGIEFNFSTQLDADGMMLGFQYDTMWLNDTNESTNAIKAAGISIWS